MAYNAFGDQGSTLTPDERAQEARRILDKLVDFKYEESEALTLQAKNYIADSLLALEINGVVNVSVSQLYWLRDSLGKV